MSGLISVILMFFGIYAIWVISTRKLRWTIRTIVREEMAMEKHVSEVNKEEREKQL